MSMKIFRSDDTHTIFKKEHTRYILSENHLRDFLKNKIPGM
ncbi:Uncharacterized protein dnm_062230 [Desulfonema magnum]|uniref:Uncharacterized protein n=1 Tax=Desulfonema magnum TaxID=45655 RepID=A0A975GQS3_9BACT|nr:Uncharacterized protein dnm_062230 [Desulfonema magnum]